MADKAKPSLFAGTFPFSSAVQNTESEVIAKNIMVILSRTGDKFRSLSWKEYKAERLKDGNFTEGEKEYFKKIKFYTVTAESARCFSKSWREL
jgi:hypothetical protein